MEPGSSLLYIAEERDNRYKLKGMRFSLDKGRNFCLLGTMKQCDRMPREFVQLPFLEVLRCDTIKP